MLVERVGFQFKDSEKLGLGQPSGDRCRGIAFGSSPDGFEQELGSGAVGVEAEQVLVPGAGDGFALAPVAGISQ